MSAVTVRWVDEEWERGSELLGLLYDVLYADFGVEPSAGWRDDSPGSAVVVALGEDGALLGTARLLPAPGEARRQVRQVAVIPGVQERGVGRALMSAVEQRAAEEGAAVTWLHAREGAFPFYERLGYEFIGDTFVSELTGIPHRTMRKLLA